MHLSSVNLLQYKRQHVNIIQILKLTACYDFVKTDNIAILILVLFTNFRIFEKLAPLFTPSSPCFQDE